MHRIVRKPKRTSKADRPGNRWQLQEAKARFSQVAKNAQTKPQIITVHGEDAVVVQSMSEFQRNQRRAVRKGPNLFAALLKCPPGPRLAIPRDPNDTIDKLPQHF